MTDVIGYGPLHGKITSDDVRKVKVYVEEGLALPQSAENINRKFSSSDFTEAKEGITTSQLEILFKSIFTNASKWSSIELDMFAVASRLNAFADDLNLYAVPAVDSIKGMEGYLDYTLQVKDLTDVQRENLVVRVGDTNTTETYADLNDYVKAIIKSIEDKKEQATKVKGKLELFGGELQDIEKDLGGRVQKVINANASTRLREITAELLKINERIDELRKKTTFTWWEWTLCGAFGAVGVGVGFGVKAIRDSEVLKDIEKERVKERELLAEQERINKIMRDLKTLHSNLYSMLLYTRGAIEGVTQIETLWSATLKEIQESKNTLDKPKEWKFLNLFVIKMESVLSRWGKIKKNVEALKAALME